MTRQIPVDLVWKTDRQDREYLFGTLQVPANIDLSKGIAILIWPNDERPQMAIRCLEKRDPPSERESENGRSYRNKRGPDC